MTEARIVETGRHVVVNAWERAVVLEDGALVRQEGPGRHRRGRRGVWHIFDLRPAQRVLAPQEVLSSEGLQVRLSAVIELTLVDPAVWLLAGANPLDTIYTRVQLLLRERVAALTVEEVLTARATLFDEGREALAAEVAALGARLDGVSIRDLTLPQELRQAFAATALAVQEGRAQLERARAESASLRSLANTAKLLEDHPALLKLRALQAGSYGSQLVLHFDEPGDAPAR